MNALSANIQVLNTTLGRYFSLQSASPSSYDVACVENTIGVYSVPYVSFQKSI